VVFKQNYLFYVNISLDKFNNKVGVKLESKYKNVRLSPETYEKLKERIKFFTDENFIEITTNAVEMYYKKLKSEGKLMKG
jgi:hypothetical protein